MSREKPQVESMSKHPGRQPCRMHRRCPGSADIGPPYLVTQDSRGWGLRRHLFGRDGVDGATPQERIPGGDV
jgi:hypothetical protein